jgi:molybdenum cofactor cytidylyltransferase
MIFGGKGPIAAVVLAAGQSSRTAPAHKLLAIDHAGESLIAHTLAHVLASSAEPIFVVLGHQADAIKRSLAGCSEKTADKLKFVQSDDYEQGLAASLRTGLAALPASVVGVLICLGDMPFVTAGTIDRLIGGFVQGSIIVPTYEGQRGNPVLWDRRFIAEMMQITGDRGARGLITQHSRSVIEISVDEDGVLRDCDTVEAVRDWAGDINSAYKQAKN